MSNTEAPFCATELRTAEIPADEYFSRYVDIPKFLAYCQKCPNYNNRWACPPYDFDVEARWREYASLRILGLKITPADDTARALAKDNPAALLAPYKQKLLQHLTGMQNDAPSSLLLSAGSCNRCTVCTRAEGQPCRFPGSAHPSIEALGGDVAKTTEELLSLKLLWSRDGQPPQYYILVCGLLMKE